MSRKSLEKSPLLWIHFFYLHYLMIIIFISSRVIIGLFTHSYT